MNVDLSRLEEIEVAVSALREGMDSSRRHSFPPSAVSFEENQITLGFDRMRELLAVALSQVPFYEDTRRQLTAPVFTLNDFPVINKSVLREYLASLLTRDPLTTKLPSQEISICTTSGSTGQATAVIRDWQARRADWDLFEMLLDDIGISGVGDTIHLGLRQLGMPLLLPADIGSQGIWWNMPLFQPDNRESRTFYQALHDFSRPSVFYGNSKLFDLADLADEQGWSFDSEAVIWSYETLTKAGRERLTKCFKGQVRNIYGLAETGLIAFECACGSLHFRPDLAVVELLDSDGATIDNEGVIGELVVTVLTSTTMPLIRYRTGDLASWVLNCPCGRISRAVSQLIGRENVRLLTRDGRKFTPYFVLSTLSEAGLTNFQLIQRSLDRIDVVYPRSVSLPAFFWQNVEDKLLEHTMNMALVPCPGDDFHYAESGKRNAAVQLLAIT